MASAVSAMLAAGAVVAVALPRLAAAAPPLVPVGFATSSGLGPAIGHDVDAELTVLFTLRSTAGGRAQPAAVAQVSRWLARAGFDGTTSADAIQVMAPARRVAALLHVSIDDYRVGSHVIFAASRPKVPSEVAPAITTILGLSDVPVAATGVVSAARDARATDAVAPADSTAPGDSALCNGDGSGRTMAEIGAHYGVESLISAGDEGGGINVAAIELGASSSSDVATYDSCMGLNSTYEVVPVDGGAPSAAGSAGESDISGTDEADLDIEQIETQAPDANVLSYEAPDTAIGFYDAIASAVNSDAAQIITISWTGCELEAGVASYARSLDALFAEASQQGQTVLAATGDDGSEGCYKAPVTPPSAATGVAVEYPADSPNVTAVGGTQIIGLSGNSPYDRVWNDCAYQTPSCANDASYGAGGGGVSTAFVEPSWQVGAAGVLAGRGEPDIALNAATDEVAFAGGSWQLFGGTSLAAPMLAGFVADVEPGCSTLIGNLAPRLYADYSADGYASPSALSDVTSSNNDFLDDSSGQYSAAPGFDLSSGLGTVQAGALVCPTISSAPSSASVGSTITISGEDLGSVTSVNFGAIQAQFNPVSATTLEVTVPDGTGSVPLTVSNFMGASLTASFTYPAAAINAPATASGVEGEPLAVSITWSGDPLPATPTVTGLPDGLNFSSTGLSSGIISGVPNNTGTSLVTLTASNSIGTASQQLVISIDASQVITPPPTTAPPTSTPAAPPTSYPTAAPVAPSTNSPTTTTAVGPTTSTPPSHSTSSSAAPTHAVLSIESAKAKATSRFVPIELECRKDACSGTSLLVETVAILVRHHNRVTVHHESIVIASSRFSIASGHQLRSSLRLTARGVRALKKAQRHPMKLTLIVTIGGTTEKRTILVS